MEFIEVQCTNRECGVKIEVSYTPGVCCTGIWFCLRCRLPIDYDILFEGAEYLRELAAGDCR